MTVEVERSLVAKANGYQLYLSITVRILLNPSRPMGLFVMKSIEIRCQGEVELIMCACGGFIQRGFISAQIRQLETTL